MGNALAWLLYVCVMTCLFAPFFRESAVKGSYQRFVATFASILAAMAGTVIGAVLGVLQILIGDYKMAAVILITGMYCLSQLKEHIDDDDWFNSQRMRLGKGFKRVRRRLAKVAIPRLAPLPSPKPT